MNYEYNYLTVKKSNCINNKLEISKHWLDTIIETCRDYSRILEELADKKEGSERALYILKANVNKDIANKIAEDIHYCKNCEEKKVRKNEKDIGIDALVLGFNGYNR